MMNKSTVKTRNAANSDTKLIPNRRVRVLAARTRSRVNFFSFNASLMFFNFCSVSAMHKVRPEGYLVNYFSDIIWLLIVEKSLIYRS